MLNLDPVFRAVSSACTQFNKAVTGFCQWLGRLVHQIRHPTGATEKTNQVGLDALKQKKVENPTSQQKSEKPKPTYTPAELSDDDIFFAMHDEATKDKAFLYHRKGQEHFVTFKGRNSQHDTETMTIVFKDSGVWMTDPNKSTEPFKFSSIEELFETVFLSQGFQYILPKTDRASSASTPAVNLAPQAPDFSPLVGELANEGVVLHLVKSSQEARKLFKTVDDQDSKVVVYENNGKFFIGSFRISYNWEGNTAMGRGKQIEVRTFECYEIIRESSSWVLPKSDRYFGGAYPTLAELIKKNFTQKTSL